MGSLFIKRSFPTTDVDNIYLHHVAHQAFFHRRYTSGVANIRGFYDDAYIRWCILPLGTAMRISIMSCHGAGVTASKFPQDRACESQ